MNVTFPTGASGTGATADLIGTAECHRLSITFGPNAINGTLCRVNFMDSNNDPSPFNTDSLAVMLQQNSGFPLGWIMPQGEDSSGYEIMCERVPASGTTVSINVIIQPIL